MDYFGGTLFALYLLDLIGYFRFSGVSFALSVPIVRRSMPDLARPVAMVGQLGLTTHGKCKLVSADRLLLRERYSFFDRGQCSVRLSIDWSSGVAEAKGGMPLVYVLSPLLGYIGFALGYWGGDASGNLPFLAMALLFVGILAAFSWHRIGLLLEEYSEDQATLWSRT